MGIKASEISLLLDYLNEKYKKNVYSLKHKRFVDVHFQQIISILHGFTISMYNKSFTSETDYIGYPPVHLEFDLNFNIEEIVPLVQEEIDKHLVVLPENELTEALYGFDDEN